VIFARFPEECLLRENIVQEASVQEFDFMSPGRVGDSDGVLERNEIEF